MNKIKSQAIEETIYGLYVWQMPDGKWVGDDDGNYLNIPSVKNDKKKMAILKEVVATYGVEEGTPVFLSGRRRVTDEEYAHQRQRLEWGLTPDPYDIGESLDQMKRIKNGN
jgi:hypothetical protein